MEITRDTLLWMYRTMVTIRHFEERLHEEAAKGKTRGSIHTSDGQEAVPTGICAHLTSEDHIGSTHRGHGHSIAKGVDPKAMMAEIFGRATGVCKGKGGSMHIADFSKGMLGTIGIVGASVPLAVGAALSAKLDGTDRVGVAFFGDGGANQGVVHESMNLASIWKLPVVFVCENNHYADATPVEYATAVPNIADRAVAYAMPGVVVDGMDVFDVYDKAGAAIGRARSGQGPTLMECKTYRYHGHFYGDDPKRYRLKEEEEAYRALDPIQSFMKQVLQENLLKAKELKSIDLESTAIIEEAAEFAFSSPLTPLHELETDVYVKFP